MSSGQEERNRVLGLPIGPSPRGRQGEEQQHVMGFPVDVFDGVNLDGLSFLAHPIREYKRWARRRRLGPYVTDENERLPIAYSVIRTEPALRLFPGVRRPLAGRVHRRYAKGPGQLRPGTMRSVRGLADFGQMAVDFLPPMTDRCNRLCPASIHPVFR